MTIPFLGMVLIPVTLFIMLMSPSYLLPLLVISSVFQAGSVINGKIGEFEFGLPPFYFVAVCIAVRYFLLAVNEGKILLGTEGFTRPIAKLLLGFWGWCFVSSFVLPRLFAGMQVYSPREGIDQQFMYQATLQWSLSNLAQALFLTLDVIAVLYAIHSVKTSTQRKRLIQALLYAGAIVMIIGVGQIFSLWMGWSFPYSLFSSNPVYDQGFDQMLGSYQRISSTFTEASYAGAFLAAIGSGLLANYLSGKRSIQQLLALVLLVVVLLATTSTTGYVAFGISAILLLTVFNPVMRDSGGWRAYAKGWTAVFAVLIVGGIILFSSPDLTEAAASVTFEKLDELSFLHRIASDSSAMLLARNTYGLGVGLGSNRPSSLFTALLSTVGIPGTLLLGILLYNLYKGFRGKPSIGRVQIAGWSLAGLLIAQVIAIPDITFSVLWAMLVVVISQFNTMPLTKVADDLRHA